MTDKTQDDFINTIEAELTAEQVAELMSLGEGDTSDSLENDDLPEVVTAKLTDEAENGEANKDGDSDAEELAKKTAAVVENPANTVIKARDGVHEIPYERLEEARQGEKHWKAQHEAAQAELAELRKQAEERASAGEAPTKADNQAAIAQTAIDQGVDPEIFGDFSEEALAKGVAFLVTQQLEARIKPLEQQLAPMQQQQAVDARESHYARIHEKHPDASSIVESTQLADWIESQPSFARDAYTGLLQSGSADQIIELFDSFKAATGVATPSPKQDVKTAALQAVAKAQAQVPTSLSDLPGGRAGAASHEEALADMGGMELVDSLDNMSPEQIDRFLNGL